MAQARRARRARRDPFEGRAGRALHLVSDAAWLGIAGLLSVVVTGTASAGRSELVLLALLAAGTLLRLATCGMYGARPARMSLLDTAREVVGATALAATCALACAAIIRADATIVVAVLTSAGLSAGCLTAGRAALHAARIRARVAGASGKPTLILGAGVVGTMLEHRLLTRRDLGLVPLGFLDADPPPLGEAGISRGPVLGGPGDLEEVVRRTGAEHVVVAFSAAPDSTVLPLLRRAQDLGLEVSLVPRLFETINERQWTEHVGGLPLVGLRMTDPYSWVFGLKHLVGRVIAAGLVVVCAPLLLAIAVAVRASAPGPVLFRQKRIGRDGQEFAILKFRSMRMAATGPADELLQRRLEAAGQAPGGVEGEDRRTRVGTFLRRSSLDELPQIFNVVLGHMSLVGPRPERPEFVALFGTSVRRYGDRHRVKSGMTGWAQVQGLRGQSPLAERVEADNWYIQNWSLWLDLKILAMTPLAVLRTPAE